MTGRFDAGVRFGGTIEKDMIAVPLGPDLTMAAVAAPAYFERHPKPAEPQDLMAHACINLRLPSLDVLYAWEFEREAAHHASRSTGSWSSTTPR